MVWVCIIAPLNGSSVGKSHFFMSHDLKSCNSQSQTFYEPGDEAAVKFHIPPPKFNSSPLKNDDWKTILSYWEGNFSGAMLNFGRVRVLEDDCRFERVRFQLDLMLVVG